MSRLTDSDTRAALAAGTVVHFVLLELQFSSGTQRLASTPFDVTWSGHTWTAAQGIGTIEPITETDTSARGLAFTLAGASSASIAGALTEPVQGCKCILRLAVLDGTTLRVDPNVWTGYLDVMTVEDVVSGPVIRVTAEHAMLAWQTPPGQLFSDAEQRLTDADDRFFEFIGAMSEATIVWPGKEAFTS